MASNQKRRSSRGEGSPPERSAIDPLAPLRALPEAHQRAIVEALFAAYLRQLDELIAEGRARLEARGDEVLVRQTFPDASGDGTADADLIAG